MQSKKLIRTVALQSLAVASLALLGSSVADEKRVASASEAPWTALLVSSGESIPKIAVKPHAAPRIKAAQERRVVRLQLAETREREGMLPIVQQTNALPEHQAALDEIIRLLPPECIARLENLYVRYDNPEQRGLAGATTVILSGNVPMNEFRALAVHEILGHFYEIGCLTGTATALNSAFWDGDTPVKVDDPSLAYYAISWDNASTMRAGMTEASFFSGYAPHDPFEDLAEGMVAALLHREEAEKLAANNPVLAEKLAWLDMYMPSAAQHLATGQFVWASSRRPWDMTKLPYEWHGPGSDVAVQ